MQTYVPDHTDALVLHEGWCTFAEAEQHGLRRFFMETFLASAIQLRAGPDKGANLKKASELVEQAASAGAQLVVLPEVFAWRGPQREELDQAESIPGATSQAMAALARRLGIHLVAGSMLECDAAADQRCFNTSLIFAPDGTTLGHYRKIHLFDVDLDSGVSIRESRTRAPGDTVSCVATTLGNVGMSVCYDVRFPELYRRLASADAEILVVPAAFTAETGRAHWEPLLRARAIENQCYVVAPNQYGPASYGADDYGHSLIIDPWGKVLAEGAADGDQVVSARLDGRHLQDLRKSLPSLRHRRLDS